MANPKNNDRRPHDPAFKRICSHPQMIADALRRYAAWPNGPLDPRTVAALDFRTLEKLPTEWVTPDFRRHLGDQVWRVRFRWAPDWSDPGGYLLILVEFQSSVQSRMALRMTSYTVRLLDELETVDVVRPGDPYPPTFSLVMHNGPRRWTAATSLDGAPAMPPLVAAARPEDVEDARRAARDLAAFQLGHAHFVLDFNRHREDDPVADNAMSLQIGLESASTPADLRPCLELLREFPDRPLAGAMLEWALRRLGVDGETAEEMKQMASLDNFRSQLEETARGWTRQWFAEGVEHGRVQGIERGIEQGMERGIERGRAEGVAAQRAGLRRQAVRLFGASANRLDPLLDEVHSAARLAEIGEWLVVDPIDRLIAKVEAAAAEDRLH